MTAAISGRPARCLANRITALGAGVGIWAAHRNSPLIIGWLPGGFQVGFVHHFKP